LRDVAGMDDGLLQAALEKLAEADIVLVQGSLAPPRVPGRAGRAAPSATAAASAGSPACRLARRAPGAAL
jgi:hypothetical protein